LFGGWKNLLNNWNWELGIGNWVDEGDEGDEEE
jgi:hypothetical protein